MCGKLAERKENHNFFRLYKEFQFYKRKFWKEIEQVKIMKFSPIRLCQKLDFPKYILIKK